MNYQSVILRIVSHAQNQQKLGLRPKSRFAVNANNFSWCKFQGSDPIPFLHKEAYIICLLYRKALGTGVGFKLDGFLKVKNSREFLKYKSQIFTVCKKCGCTLDKPRKDGLCLNCRPRTGEANSFFGKHHSKETKEKLHASSSTGSKRNWQNPEYRQKVISHATGVKRSEEFKEGQRQNAFKQFEDPAQRKSRSEKMKHTWETGHLIPTHTNNGRNFSKEEIDFGERLKKELKEKSNLLERGISVRFEDGHFYLPDFVFNKKYIIEFKGDYWHANPKFYKADESIKYYGGERLAKEVWEKDKKREQELRDKTYIIVDVWEGDFKRNPEEEIQKVLKQILL